MSKFDSFANVADDDRTKLFTGVFSAAEQVHVDIARADEIRQRLAAATRRPWYRTGIEGLEIRAAHTLLATVRSGIGDGPDAEFIACAPADIAWLLADLDRTRAELAAANAATARAHVTINDLCAAAWLGEEAAR